jgi:hypothetical protein
VYHEKYFSSPITWKTGLIISIDKQNYMTVGAPTGPVTGTALSNGILVYRPDSTSSGATTGSLELIFQPSQWSKELIDFFDQPVWTELPPGRLIYSGLLQSAVKDGLHQLLFNAFTAYQANHTQVHPGL